MPKTKVNAQFLSLNYKTWEGWGRHQQLLQEHLEFAKDSPYKLVLANPYEMVKSPGDKIIYMSTFEADKLPDQFIGPANDALAVIVPDTWVKNVFINSGVKVPIYIMPEGITDNTVWQPDRPPFTFLHFDFTSQANRKGGDLVLEAFVNLFSNMPGKVRLILKGRDHQTPFIRKYTNVEYIFQNYTQQQMDILWSQTHCFVFPSRGEGFGLPPLEAMGHGIPTIVTKGSAMETFSWWGIPLSTKGKVPATYDHYTGFGQWDLPDVTRLTELMLMVFQNYQREKQNAELNSNIVYEHYQFDHLAPQLAELVNAIVSEDSKSTTPPIIVDPSGLGEVTTN